MRTTAEQNEKSVTTDTGASVLNTPLAPATHDVEHVERYISADVAALSRHEQCWTFVPESDAARAAAPMSGSTECACSRRP
jgi:hypothetical protein